MDIVAVLDHYTEKLERYVYIPVDYRPRPMNCPFHDDRNASASVNTTEGWFRCHACDMRGDAAGLIAKHEGVPYGEAVERAQTISGAGDGSVPGEPGERSGESRLSAARKGSNRRRGSYLPSRKRRFKPSDNP